MRGTVLSEEELEVGSNGADGPVLAMASVSEIEEGTASFTVPDASPGYYVVTAVQDDAKGNDMIARAAFRSSAPPASCLPAPLRPSAAPIPTAPVSPSMVGLAFALGISGPGLAGTGGMVMAGHARRRKVAVVASSAERH